MIIPLENYNGRKIVENGQLCERKNGRGVDINRNWSLDWGKKEQDFDPAEEFPGNAPFSEPETRIMRDLASSFKPHLWINVHSGMQAMFTPYDHKRDLPDPRVAEPMKLLLQKLNHLHCNNSCVIGSGGSSVGYLAHGTATDYMYEVLGVPLAFTFEIYGDMEAPNEDCFRMFNPTTLETYESIVTNWSMAFITIFVKLETLFYLHGLCSCRGKMMVPSLEGSSTLTKFLLLGTQLELGSGTMMSRPSLSSLYYFQLLTWPSFGIYT
ncbi:hypothetical protein GOP47_0022630 [Adiantum capillus-veneris]|uniref:Peptidase M14 domain-containing protein n=1 Tax=Adiantum capillus-veneris TaxID=13818 RepID=A0A9D4U5R8_ADICA|nr:hypothetical protein GOP47_0022630 [Adiantum capillus-veneris]